MIVKKRKRFIPNLMDFIGISGLLKPKNEKIIFSSNIVENKLSHKTFIEELISCMSTVVSENITYDTISTNQFIDTVINVESVGDVTMNIDLNQDSNIKKIDCIKNEAIVTKIEDITNKLIDNTKEIFLNKTYKELNDRIELKNHKSLIGQFLNSSPPSGNLSNYKIKDNIKSCEFIKKEFDSLKQIISHDTFVSSFISELIRKYNQNIHVNIKSASDRDTIISLSTLQLTSLIEETFKSTNFENHIKTKLNSYDTIEFKFENDVEYNGTIDLEHGVDNKEETLEDFFS